MNLYSTNWCGCCCQRIRPLLVWNFTSEYFRFPTIFLFFSKAIFSLTVYIRGARVSVFAPCSVCVCGMGFDRRCFSKTVQIVLGVLKYIWAHRRIVIGQINFYTKYIYSFDGVLNRPICCLRSPRTLTRAIPFHCSIFNKYLMLLVCVCVSECLACTTSAHNLMRY